VTEALYVYGIGPSSGLHAPAVCGIAGSAPETLEAGGLTVLAGRFDTSVFGKDVLASSDPRAVEAHLRAHEAVLDAAMGEATIIPMRFGTVVADTQELARVLELHRAEIVAALDRVRDRVEWGVKLHCDYKSLAARLDTEAADGDAPRSGREYLMSRRRRQANERMAQAEVLDMAAAVHHALADAADDATTSASGSKGAVLNAAYLVRRSGRDAFMDRVASLEGRYGRLAAVFEVTGPWPPYNFAQVRIDGG
jgi:hypothetical protein